MVSDRSTVIYDIPIPHTTIFSDVASVILRFPDGRTIDVGRLCYLRRDPGNVGRRRALGKSDTRGVEIDSLTATRIKSVRSLIFHISETLRLSGKRPLTVHSSASRFLTFMTWADSQGHHAVLDDPETARGVIAGYSRYLKERVSTNAISLNSGVHQQTAVFQLLSEFFQCEGLTRGMPMLYKDESSVEHTAPPNEEAQASVLQLSESIFNDFTTFLLQGKTYPHALSLPCHLNYPNDRLWLFPSIAWCKPKGAPNRIGGRPMNTAYNYEQGRLYLLGEITGMNPEQALSGARRQLANANADLRHHCRLRLGMFALNNFVLLFLAQTGMNWAQLVSLEWTGDYEATPIRQLFRSIKWRAGGRTVSFELPMAFMPKFKQFLLLREFLLAGRPCGWLFFKLGTKGEGKPRQFKASTHSIFSSLRRIDPDLPNITTRQWRAAKSDWLLRNTDPSTAALILQNSEKTVLASYAAGSETAQLSEITNFLNQVSERVAGTNNTGLQETSRAIGNCSSYGFPNKLAEAAPVSPDCKTQEGCLFCDKFKVHADELDVRKLLSCRYCLKHTASLSDSYESYESALSPIFQRIDSILAEISRRDHELVQKIQKQVEEEGELDPYWAGKFAMLLELGIIG